MLVKTTRKVAIEQLDEAVGDSYNLKQSIAGAQKARTGFRAVGRGVAIAATLAAMDGPLPFGDVLAAGFLIGGGTYMAYSGVKDVLQ